MKRLITTIIVLLGVLGFAFVSEHQAQTAQQKRPVVGILQTLSHPALDQIRKGIIAGLKAEGYVDGKNVVLDVENAQGDQSNLKSMADKFMNKNARVTVGIATPAVQALANQTTATPVVMGGISDPLGTGLVKNLQHPGGKVTGTKEQEPVAQQVAMIRAIMPNLKTIGVLHTSSDDSSTAEYQEFRKLMEAQGVTVKSFTITSTNDISQTAETMVRQVEAVYVPTDNTVASGIMTLAKAVDGAKIPLFPAVATMMKPAGVATISSSQFDMGVVTGKMVARVLRGEKPATMAVEQTKKVDTTINLKQARKLGLTIPQRYVDAAEKRGEIIQ